MSNKINEICNRIEEEFGNGVIASTSKLPFLCPVEVNPTIEVYNIPDQLVNEFDKWVMVLWEEYMTNNDLFVNIISHAKSATDKYYQSEVSRILFMRMLSMSSNKHKIHSKYVFNSLGIITTLNKKRSLGFCTYSQDIFESQKEPDGYKTLRLSDCGNYNYELAA
jgi:hypothetical protein